MRTKPKLVKEIKTIIGGPIPFKSLKHSHRMHTKEAKQLEKSQKHKQPTSIMYYVRHVQYPHDDTLIIIVRIVNHNVHCVLVNSGSSMNILSRTTYDQMGFLDNQLKSSPMLPYGFI